MPYISVFKGVIFVEGDEPSAKTIRNIEYDKKFSYNSQLKNLDVVKDQLADKALALGGNAVLNFRYGQQSSGWFKSVLLALDDNIKWYGSGTAAVIPEETKAKILEKLYK